MLALATATPAAARGGSSRTPSTAGRCTRSGGELALSVAEGDGEFAEPVSYQPSHQRWYVLHRIGPMTAQLTAAGFAGTSFSRRSTHRDWLQLRARRR